MYWTEAIDRPGAFQIGYLRKLIESRPQLTRIPDQSVILDGQGEKGDHICATRDSNGSYIMVYIPVGKKITLSTNTIQSKKLNFWWLNPKNGEMVSAGKLKNLKTMEFTPPTLGIENDWVLVLDNPKYGYKNPFLK